MDGQEVCRALHISKRTLQFYRDHGIVGYTFIDRKCYYKASEIKALLDSKMKVS